MNFEVNILTMKSSIPFQLHEAYSTHLMYDNNTNLDKQERCLEKVNIINNCQLDGNLYDTNHF